MLRIEGEVSGLKRKLFSTICLMLVHRVKSNYYYISVRVVNSYFNFTYSFSIEITLASLQVITKVSLPLRSVSDLQLSVFE